MKHWHTYPKTTQCKYCLEQKTGIETTECFLSKHICWSSKSLHAHCIMEETIIDSHLCHDCVLKIWQSMCKHWASWRCKYSYMMPSKPQQQRFCSREIEGIEPVRCLFTRKAWIKSCSRRTSLSVSLRSAIVSLRRHWFASMVCCSSPDLWPPCGRGRIEEDIPSQQEQHSPILMEDFYLWPFCLLSQKHFVIAKIMWWAWLVPVLFITNKPRYTQFYSKTKTIFVIILHKLHKMQYFVTINETFFIFAFYHGNELKLCSVINCRNWLSEKK